MLNIGDLVRVKKIRSYDTDERNGQIGVITRIVGKHYYAISFDDDCHVYSDVALEVLC